MPGVVYAGMYVTSNTQDTLSTAVFDNIYIGEPREPGMLTTWVGNTFSQASAGSDGLFDDGHVSLYIQCLWVDLDGTCWTGASYDENGDACKIYKDGRIVRTLSDNDHFGNNPTVEGGVVGNSSYSYVWCGVVGNKRLSKVDKQGNWIKNVTFTNTIGTNITGMALSATATHELYISDLSNNRVLVVDTNTDAELPGRAFSFTQQRPGPIAVDIRGDLWIIQEGWTSPFFHQTAPTLATGVFKYSKLGVDSTKSIADMVMPTSLCIDPNNDLLYVTENGPDQNIRVYGNLSSTPALHHTFGQRFGIYSGGTPGAIHDANFGGWQRFYSLVGVGIDQQGSIYVACDQAGTDLRKFDSQGNLIWQLHANEDGFGCPDFDPSTDGADLYSMRLHHTLDLTQTTPGGEWGYKGFTRNPFLHPTDPRPFQSAQPIMRRIHGQKFLFMSLGNSPNDISFYRFDDQGLGETSILCGALRTVPNASPPGMTVLWLDLNGDGVEQPLTEDTHIPSPLGATGSVPSMAYDVAQNGDIYWLMSGGIMHLTCLGIGTTGYPIYNLVSGYEFTPLPAPFTNKFSSTANGYRICYDSISDIMYLSGNTSTEVNFFAGAVFARYDNWSVVKNSNPVPRYVVSLPNLTTDNNWYTQPAWSNNDPSLFAFKSFHVAGDYVFFWEEFGQIHVYDALTGNPFTRLCPGAEVNGTVAFTDPDSARSFKTSTGEYLLAFESSGYKSKLPLYRWTPSRDTANWPGIPVNLTATSDNGFVQLKWLGPFGVTDSYRVYRRIDWQAETIVVYDLHKPNYRDYEPPVGSMCSYRVTAINEVGEGAKSEEAFATPLAATCEYVRVDTTSQGAWKPLYGKRGNFIAGDTNNLGENVIFDVHTNIQTLLASGSSDARALQLPAHESTTRELARWYNQITYPTFFFGTTTMDMNIVDGSLRQLALYFVAWNSTSNQIRVEIKDAISGVILDQRNLASFDQGKYLVWNVSGHITINVVPLVSEPAEINGIFLGYT
jgi:sugar lactone lactonase YvrE